MDTVTCAGSFLLGGVSAVTLMGVLLLVMQKSPKKSKKAQPLSQVLTIVQELAERRDSLKLSPWEEVEKIEALANQPAEEGVALNQRSADGRWGMEYTPSPGLL
jgi:hypothetical protein